MMGNYQGASGKNRGYEGKNTDGVYNVATHREPAFTGLAAITDPNSLVLGASEQKYSRLRSILVGEIRSFKGDCRLKSLVNQIGTLYITGIEHIDLLVARLDEQDKRVDTQRVNQLKKDLIYALHEMIGGNAPYFIPKKDDSSRNGDFTKEWLLWQEVQREISASQHTQTPVIKRGCGEDMSGAANYRGSAY